LPDEILGHIGDVFEISAVIKIHLHFSEVHTGNPNKNLSPEPPVISSSMTIRHTNCRQVGVYFYPYQPISRKRKQKWPKLDYLIAI
jgi:hypothetical protein